MCSQPPAAGTLEGGRGKGADVGMAAEGRNRNNEHQQPSHCRHPHCHCRRHHATTAWPLPRLNSPRTQLVGGGVELRRGGARPVLARLPEAALINLQRAWHAWHVWTCNSCHSATHWQSCSARRDINHTRAAVVRREGLKAQHMRRTWRPCFVAIPTSGGAPPYPAQTPPPPLAAPVQSPPPQTRCHPPAAACAAHTGRGAHPRAASRPPRCSWRRPRLQGCR